MIWLAALTDRESEIANLIAVDGLTSKEAARSLGLSYRTVEAHRSRIFRKLGLQNVVQLARVMASREVGQKRKR
jgi:two-component system, LuxR family, response regulator FixJ